ncbi:MAG TPA: hypothetical protein VGN46_13030 [Luteibacter sp.]|jgi:hypothetical protein|uniref:hypothetical protein n=1 Tax=Luteibacter sp. TaxID=1886636 RepID=UPI002F4210D5
MKIHRTYPTLAMALLVAMAAPAHTDDGRAFPPPELGDTYLLWTLERLRGMESEADFHSDDFLRATYLNRAPDIYSTLASPFYLVPSERDEAAWLRVLGRLHSNSDAALPGDQALHRQMAWDLGMTAAIPGLQVLTDPATSTAGNMIPVGAASLAKAGVSRANWTRAVNFADPGGRLITLGSELAVSLQILEGWVANTEATKARRLGIDANVLVRFDRARGLRDMPDSDLAYLAALLRSELSTWRAGRAALDGHRELPTPLRVARATMVHGSQYADNDGFRSCNDDGTRVPAVAGRVPEDLSLPICPAEATDRAVYRRYRALRRMELNRPSSDFVDPTQAARLVRHFGDMRPAWASIYRDEVLSYSNHAEVVESQMAAESDPGTVNDINTWRLTERVNLLICRSAAR